MTLPIYSIKLVDRSRTIGAESISMALDLRGSLIRSFTRHLSWFLGLTNHIGDISGSCSLSLLFPCFMGARHYSDEFATQDLNLDLIYRNFWYVVDLLRSKVTSTRLRTSPIPKVIWKKRRWQRCTSNTVMGYKRVLSATFFLLDSCKEKQDHTLFNSNTRHFAKIF